MKQLGFLVHVERCLGCRSCEFACKNEKGHEDTFRRKIHVVDSDPDNNGHNFHHFSMACNHCQNPACMAACPEIALKKNASGIVIIDTHKCNGCGRCVPACPFDAIQINPITAKADKCDMCYERQAIGDTTACIASCPVQALEIIDINDPNNSELDRATYGFQNKMMTNPSIRFTNKEKKTKQFWSN